MPGTQPFIAIGNYQGFPGEEIIVDINIINKLFLQQNNITNLSFDLQFNPTLLITSFYYVDLMSTKNANIHIDNIAINYSQEVPLLKIPFIVGLGNSNKCELTISNVEPIGGTADISLINGKFTLLGICEEGGSRLINPEKITKLMQISPNPSDGNVNVELNLVEKGNTILKVFSVSGELIEEIMISNKSGNINIELDTKNYGNGLYFIHLQTPAINKIEKLIIYK